MLEVMPVRAFSDNYIWLIINPRSRATVIVDPGDAQPVMEALLNHDFTPVAIFATHHHGDHVGGVERLLAHRAVPVFGPAREAIPGITRMLREGDSVAIEELDASFDVLDVPGHTRGHIAFHGNGMAFVGDTLFTAGCGRLFEGTAAQMYASLSRLAALPDSTRIYCGHEYTEANLRFAESVEPGNPDIRERVARTAALRQQGQPTVPASIDLERRTNPFLRTHLAPVIAAASSHAGRPLEDPVSVFAEVRAWKDSFKG